MDKKKILESVKIDLSEIKSNMAQVENDIVHISSCIEQGKFIPQEISKNVITFLEKLQRANENCRKQYESLSENPFEFVEIENFEYLLHEKEEQIRREEIIATAELFLKLHAQEEDIEELLVGEQVKLMGILPVSEDGEEELLKIKPYVDFIEVFKDKKLLEPAAIVEAIINLRTYFGDGLIGAAFCKNSVNLEKESETGEDEESGQELAAEDLESMSVVQDTESSEEGLPKEAEGEKETQEQPEEAAKTQFQEKQEEEPITEQEFYEKQETKQAENEKTTEQSFEQEMTLAETLVEAGAILPETYEFGKVKIEKGDREDKKFGVNSFKSDLRGGYTLMEKRVLVIIRKRAAVTIDDILREDDLSEERGIVQYAFQHLVKKGYLRKYTINGIGSFYCITKKASHAFTSKEACSYLGVRRTEFESGYDMVGESAAAVVSRIAYAKILEKDLHMTSHKDFSIDKTLFDEAFILCNTELEQETELLVGCFWGNQQQCEEFDKKLKETLEEMQKISHVIFVGMEREQALALAQIFGKRYDQFLPEEKYAYALKEDCFFAEKDGTEVDASDIWQEQEENQDLSEGEDTEQLPETKEDKKNTESDNRSEAENETETEVIAEKGAAKTNIGSERTVEKEHTKTEVISETETDSIAEEENTQTNMISEEGTTETEKEKTEAEDSFTETVDQSYRLETAKNKTYDSVIFEGQEPQSEVVKQQEEQILLPASGLENVLQQAYQMIVSGRTYCAVAYLKANSEMYDEIDTVYEKLAYAVNEPFQSCSYSSGEIFDIFLDQRNVFSDYLMISAALRTFFYNHAEYDYSMKSLYENIKNLPEVSAAPELGHFLYFLMEFKEQERKGIDVYADYRMKDKIFLEHNISRIRKEAEGFYEVNILGHVTEQVSNRRYLETRNIIFSRVSEIAIYLKYIIDGDDGVLDLMKEYLAEYFMKEKSPVDAVNIDREKMNTYIDTNWDKARDKMNVTKKTSDLMSRLRHNLYNSLLKAVSIMCEWVKYMERFKSAGEDAGFEKYKQIKDKRIHDIAVMASEFENKAATAESVEEKAGIRILVDALNELKARLDGSYNEMQQKYFYMDFLKSDLVLLDGNYLPILDGDLQDIPELEIAARIFHHSKRNLGSLEDRLYDIFKNAGDDYGCARLIDQYFVDTTGHAVLEEHYDLEESISYAKRGAEQTKNEFVENLELAQSYGQIDNSQENKKEKILQIVNRFYEYANSTDNYGFFKKITEAYMSQIKKDAKVREEPLRRELALYHKNLQAEAVNEDTVKRLDKIQKMLENQNYTVAEDLLSRLKDGETEGELEIFETDYLSEFMKEYEYYRRTVVDNSRSVSKLLPSQIRNKEGRGAQRLIDSWIVSGQNAERVKNLLQALGFTVETVKEQEKIGKYENYNVMLTKPKNGRKANFKHPIAALGSRAAECGFRVVCLYGKYDANRIIEVMKELGNAKNTMIFLDGALSIQDRRMLARKVKSDVPDKIFGIVDRVLLAFLVNHYNEEYINKMLMCIMMPFTYYQPYIWDSSNEMPPEIFMGRKDELREIEAPGGVNIVYGGRQLGKSALLRMAKNDIDHNENGDRAVLVVIKNMDYKKTARAVGEALYLAGILKRDPETEDWDELVKVIKRRLLLGIEENIPYLLLLLDEADAFIESCEEVDYHPFDALKDLQGIGIDRFKFVIAGLRNIIRFNREKALGNNSVLTQLASMTVKPFQVNEARELLEIPLYYLGLRFQEDKESLISLIFASANYFPGLIQLYCAKLLEAMRKGDYAGYSESDTPPYEVQESHIKKVLADKGFMEQIQEKFDITLRLDDDNYYHIIALLISNLYHEKGDTGGYTPREVQEEGEIYEISKIEELSLDKLTALMEELCELNVLRKTSDQKYLFNQYRFHQMMGSHKEVDDKLMKYMEESNG